MKDFLIAVGIILLTIAVIVGLLYFTNLIGNAGTVVTVHEPEPGIHCAVATHGEGVAVSCYPVPEKK